MVKKCITNIPSGLEYKVIRSFGFLLFDFVKLTLCEQ